MDESGFNLDMQRLYGWGIKGKRVLKSGNRKGQRLSVIAVVAVVDNGNNLLHPFKFKGTMTKELFKQYLKKILLPNLPKNSYLIMDNASFHKGKDIEELIRSYFIRPLFLPPYSPDLNPIEKKWSQIKKIYKQYTEYFDDKPCLIDLIIHNKYARLS